MTVVYVIDESNICSFTVTELFLLFFIEKIAPKNHILPILGGAREIFWVFHVKNHDFTPKKNHIFTNFRRARAGCAPPPPDYAFDAVQ